jgi:parvulin-like peptidyl-prolyl isomerase
MEGVSKERKEAIQKWFRKYAVATIAAFVFSFLVVTLLFFYLGNREQASVKNITQALPYPIVWVGGEWISERELASNMKSVRRFYENQDFASLGLRVDFTTEEGKKRLQVREREVLNKMLEDKAFVRIAEKKGIRVTEEEVKQDIKNRLDTYGTGEEVARNLDRLYGFSVQDFAERVVMPALYQAKLEAVYKKETSQTEQKSKIEEAERTLGQGTTFEEVAKKYSEGGTRENGGSLGWFQLTDLAPELQDLVKGSLVGKVSGIAESSLGFHIIRVDEVKNDKEVVLYRLAQVFVRKDSFSNWLTREMQALSIAVWSPFYQWNEAEAQIEFAKEWWQQYEQEVYKNSAQDAVFVN